MKPIHMLPLLALMACTNPTTDIDAADPMALDYRDDFRATEDAWAQTVGTLPEQCRTLTARVLVSETTKDELASVCPAEPGFYTLGCFLAPEPGLDAEPVIYLATDVEAATVSDSAIHEWVHALAWCVYGEPDTDHARAPLWDPEVPGVLWLAIELRAGL